MKNSDIRSYFGLKPNPNNKNTTSSGGSTSNSQPASQNKSTKTPEPQSDKRRKADEYIYYIICSEYVKGLKKHLRRRKSIRKD